MLPTDLASSPDDRVLPAFGGRSILNLVTSLTAQLGLPPVSPLFTAALPLEGAERVVLFVVDGMGHYLLDQHLERGEMPWLAEQIQSGSVGYQTATSTFPSSTMIAMTTLYTGVAPAQHGWLGTSIYWQDTVADILFQQDLMTGRRLAEPERLLRVPSIFRRLAAVGVPSYCPNPAVFQGSFLTDWFLSGATPLRYSELEEIPALSSNAASRPGPQFQLAYVPDYDSACHLTGSDGAEAAAIASRLDAAFEALAEMLPCDGRTLLVVTADHGQRLMSATGRRQLESGPGFPWPLPAGENRVRYFDVPQEEMQAVRDDLSGYAACVPSGDVWAQGWYGGPPADPEFLKRTGTLTAIAHENDQMGAEYPGAAAKYWYSLHGGLSAMEMVVPVLTIRR